MLYDHWENSRLVFECCAQIVILTTFVTKLFNDFWNHDKVCVQDTRLFVFFNYYYYNKILLLLSDSTFMRSYGESLEYIYKQI